MTFSFCVFIMMCTMFIVYSVHTSFAQEHQLNLENIFVYI